MIKFSVKPHNLLPLPAFVTARINKTGTHQVNVILLPVSCSEIKFQVIKLLGKVAMGVGSEIIFAM